MTVGLRIRSLQFRGGDSNVIHDNLGACVYGRHAIDLHITDCSLYSGGALFQQDTTSNTIGQGDSLAISASVVTLTDAAGLFSSGQVNHSIVIANAANPVNNGLFRITKVISPTQIQYVNANAIAETSGFRWTVEDSDSGAILEKCHSFEAHNVVYAGSNSTIRDNIFEQPGDYDMVGIGDQFTFDGISKVTLYDAAGRFEPQFDGKYIQIANATSANNDGIFKLTYIDANHISWTNALGVSELFSGTWYIQNGTKSGTGAGVGSISVAGTTVTFTSAQAIFDASDVNMSFRPVGCANQTNIGAFRIEAVLSPTQIQYEDSSAINENFSGMWALDPWDGTQTGSGATANTYGTTHAIYLFSGGANRYNVNIHDNTFLNIRTCCVKVSGTALPILGIRIHSNFAKDCGPFVIAGADGQQEHTDIQIHANQLHDVGTQRIGWNNNDAIQILGAREVSITSNQFYYTHNNVLPLSGLSLGSQHAIECLRYANGVSQPLESLHIAGNTFSAIARDTTSNMIVQVCISAQLVGILAKWGTITGLTKSGTTMTLSDSNAEFLPQEQVGQTVTIVNATHPADNGSFTVTAATTTTLQFTNAAGVGGAGGTYRLQGTRRGAGVSVVDNHSQQVGYTFGDFSQNAAIMVRSNSWNGCVSGIRFAGDCSPEATDNREISTITQAPRMRIDSGTSWPRLSNNTITNSALDSIGTAFARDIGVSVDAGAQADYPLLGDYVRARPSQGQEEVVLAYGSNFVDGDTFSLVDTGGTRTTTFTYKAVAPGANQFNSFAGLIALINAIGGYTAADYGTGLSGGDVATEHIRIRATVVTTSDGTWSVKTSALNPTALVLLRNQPGNNVGCDSRGAASAGPVTDKTVIWSPCCTFAGGGSTMIAENASAMTLLAGGYLRKTNVNDAACCNLMQHGASAGTEEFRVVVNSAS